MNLVLFQPLTILFSLFLTGHGLKCYQCLTTKGWDDCKSIQKEVNCRPGTDTCGKGLVGRKSGGVSISAYGKGCTVSSECNTKSLCKHSDPTVTFTECAIYCCSDDLCNGAKIPMVSAIMLLTCVLVAFLR